MVVMETLYVKIGVDLLDDLRAFKKNPKSEALYKNTLYLKSPEEFLEIFSPQKIGLLKQLMDYEPSEEHGFVSDIAKATGRKQEAISRDAKSMEKHGLIEKQRKGNKTYLKPKIDSIEIRFK